MKKYRKIGLIGPFIALITALLSATVLFGVPLSGGSGHAVGMFGTIIFFAPQALFFSLIGYLAGGLVGNRSSEKNKSKHIAIYLALVLIYFLLLIKFIISR